MKAGGLRLSGQLEIPEGHLQPSPSQLLSVLCTALMLNSFSGSQLPSLLSNRAPHSVLITMSRAGLMNFIFFFPFPFSGNLARYQNAALPLSVECGAQLFVLPCQAWSDCSAYFQQWNWQDKQEEKAWLSVIKRY